MSAFIATALFQKSIIAGQSTGYFDDGMVLLVGFWETNRFFPVLAEPEPVSARDPGKLRRNLRNRILQRLMLDSRVVSLSRESLAKFRELNRQDAKFAKKRKRAKTAEKNCNNSRNSGGFSSWRPWRLGGSILRFNEELTRHPGIHHEPFQIVAPDFFDRHQEIWSD